MLVTHESLYFHKFFPGLILLLIKFHPAAITQSRRKKQTKTNNPHTENISIYFPGEQIIKSWYGLLQLKILLQKRCLSLTANPSVNWMNCCLCFTASAGSTTNISQTCLGRHLTLPIKFKCRERQQQFCPNLGHHLCWCKYRVTPLKRFRCHPGLRDARSAPGQELLIPSFSSQDLNPQARSLCWWANWSTQDDVDPARWVTSQELRPPGLCFHLKYVKDLYGLLFHSFLYVLGSFSSSVAIQESRNYLPVTMHARNSCSYKWIFWTGFTHQNCRYSTITESDFPVLNCSRTQDWLRAELQPRDHQNAVACLCKDQLLLKKVSVTLIELFRPAWKS